ncbi:hypothetical protein PENTCL1PPCAC_13354, partial [Pristionchus entomophagus]
WESGDLLSRQAGRRTDWHLLHLSLICLLEVNEVEDEDRDDDADYRTADDQLLLRQLLRSDGHLTSDGRRVFDDGEVERVDRHGNCLVRYRPEIERWIGEEVDEEGAQGRPEGDG